MGGLRQYIGYGAAIAGLVAVVGIVGGPRYWESRQLKQEIEGAVVRHIEPYPYNTHGGDLHWSLRGNRIFIEGENRVIDFPQSRWDETVQEGDSVDLIVRQSFPWGGLANELDGLYINNDHK